MTAVIYPAGPDRGHLSRRLTADPIAATAFTDPKAGKDTRRFWVVVVNGLGQAGIPSAPAWFERQYRKYYEPFTGAWHQSRRNPTRPNQVYCPRRPPFGDSLESRL
jgi:hypothetical protein